MLITPQQLPSYLKQHGLSSAYLLYGAAPLLVMEAADLIRATAKTAGFYERHTLYLEAKSDWNSLDESANTLSLFGDLRLLNIRLTTAKPGKTGGEALVRLANRLPESTITLIELPTLDRDALKSAWFIALSKVCTVVEGKTIPLHQLPDWLKQRAITMKLDLSTEAATWLAQKTEGHLLAAHQELLKLSLMLSDNKDNNNNMNNMTHVNLETVKETVLDVARYDLYQLGHAIQSGNGLRALKILEGLEAEKEAFPLIIWQVSETARSIAKGEGSLRGVNTAMLTYLFQQLALMDAQFKGIKEGDPWASLRACIVMMTMA